jgi:hypothetical protein
VWSLVLAGWATLVIVALFAGAFAGLANAEGGAEALGVLLMFLAVVPSMIGIGLGLSSFTRGRTSPLPWTATIWHGVILTVWILLTIAGLMMS